MTRWPFYSSSCIEDLVKLMRSGKSLTAYRANKEWGTGPQKWSQVYAFEREVEKAFKVRHAVAVSSGTAALHAGLRSLGVEGKDVITSPYTFSATASAILLAGGIPRFADVDPQTFCITKETVKKHVTKKTAAILPVHLFGYFQDLSGLQGLGLPIVEDACQAVGASRGGKFSGTVGSAGVYSFNGSKNLPTGEGGCLVTNDSKLAEKARLLVNHGENFNSDIGLNYRMHELVAVLARHGLKELERRNARRIELAMEVGECLGDYRFGRPWFMPRDHVYYVYPFKVGKNRSRFISRCAKRGLPVQESYTTPLHHLRAFRKYCDRKLPVVDELHERTLCLLTTLTPDRDLSYARKVAGIIREALDAV